MNRSRWPSWMTLGALVTMAIAVVAIPVFLIRPSSAQTPGAMALAYYLRRWAPWITPVAAAGGLFLTFKLWRSARWSARTGAVLLWLPSAAAVWVARQNLFELMFAPLPDARFVRPAQADFVEPKDVVLAVEHQGDAAAYPVRQLAYHHVVEDVIGGVPIVATY